MCDNDAASIAAVAEVPEVDRGRFEPAAPCDVQRLLARLRSDDRARGVNAVAGNDTGRPEPRPSGEQNGSFDAACTGTTLWPLPSPSVSAALGQPRGLGWHPGYSARIERPPSAA
ncbi:MAG TPA: hypothetical protein VMG12_30470 [Polyangiaceae bacterium]|nr:hypothetical protein [Polyangiaceae bacterium]